MQQTGDEVGTSPDPHGGTGSGDRSCKPRSPRTQSRPAESDHFKPQSSSACLIKCINSFVKPSVRWAQARMPALPILGPQTMTTLREVWSCRQPRNVGESKGPQSACPVEADRRRRTTATANETTRMSTPRCPLCGRWSSPAFFRSRPSAIGPRGREDVRRRASG